MKKNNFKAGRLEIGTRVLCKGIGVFGTVDDYGVYNGQLTYVVKFEETQLSGGFEYGFKEFSRDEITTSFAAYTNINK